MSLPPDDHWDHLVGDEFRAPWGALTLTEVDRRDAHNFALLFSGPLDGPRSQSIFELSHDGHGPMEIFLVPIGADDAHVHYEAVFSRVPGNATP